MVVEIKHGLVCDVIHGVYQGKAYCSGIVYEKGTMYRLRIKDEALASDMESSLASYADFVCDMSTYQGKNKFTLRGITPTE